MGNDIKDTVRVTDLDIIKKYIDDASAYLHIPAITFSNTLAKNMLKIFPYDRIANLILQIYVDHNYIPDCPCFVENKDFFKALCNRVQSWFGSSVYEPMVKGVFQKNKLVILPKNMSITYFEKKADIYGWTPSLNILPDFEYFYTVDLSRDVKYGIFRRFVDNYKNFDYILSYLDDNDVSLFFKVIESLSYRPYGPIAISEIFCTKLFNLPETNISRKSTVRSIWQVMYNYLTSYPLNAYMTTPDFIRNIKTEYEKYSFGYGYNKFNLNMPCSRYIKTLLKKGLTTTEATSVFTMSNLSAYISSDYFTDKQIEKYILNRDLTKKETELLIKHRPKLFSKISADLVSKKIKTTMYNALPNSILDLISKDLIKVELNVECDSEALELYQELSDFV